MFSTITTDAKTIIACGSSDIAIIQQKVTPVSDPISPLELGVDTLVTGLFIEFPYLKVYKKLPLYNYSNERNFLLIDEINFIAIERRIRGVF